MQDKVWIIDDPDDSFEDKNKGSDATKLLHKKSLKPRQKNPALAFTISLFIWGSGQIYTGKWKIGILFMLFMLNFYIFTGSAILFGGLITAFLKNLYVTYSEMLAVFIIIYLCGIIIWFFNAYHAYHSASLVRQEPFPGVKSRLLPVLCSLLIPGWGQFINGQRKKGLYFLVFATIGFFVLPFIILIFLLWPEFISEERYCFESLLAVLLMFIPLIILMWLISAFDALKVSFDDVKKESLINRIKYANNRRRIKGFFRGLIPQAKLTILLSLILVLLISISYSYFPKEHYSSLLKDLQSQLQQRDMIIIPQIINELLNTISPETSFSGQNGLNKSSP